MAVAKKTATDRKTGKQSTKYVNLTPTSASTFSNGKMKRTATPMATTRAKTATPKSRRNIIK